MTGLTTGGMPIAPRGKQYMDADSCDIWSSDHAGDYERENYQKGLAGRVLKRSHSLVERELAGQSNFSRVLEVGCGTGLHPAFVRHGFDAYCLTDASDDMLQIAKSRTTDNRFTFVRTPAENLPFADASFDRVIACHVLEHIYRPHEALHEWDRVLKPNGVLSLILPCDPGLAWRLGRYFGPRRNALKRGLAYDYVMAREHVNPIGNLVALIRHYFRNRREIWWPFRIPSVDLNLIYTVNVWKTEE